MVTSNGCSPLTVRGLDPGMMYSVMINVFDGNQVVLRGRVVRKTITVISATVTSGKIVVCSVICLSNNNLGGFFNFSIIATDIYIYIYIYI